MALVREMISDDMEILFNKASTFEEIHRAAKKSSQLAGELWSCIATVQEFLQERTERLVLHNKPFFCYNPAEEVEISLFFQASNFI